MSYIDGKLTSSSCSNCKYWEEHIPEGTCSQKVKTVNGFTQQITPKNYLCSSHEENKTKFDFRLKVTEKDGVKISGVFSKNTLLKAKEFIDNKLKEF